MRCWLLIVGLSLAACQPSARAADPALPTPSTASNTERTVTLEASIKADQQQLEKLRKDLAVRQKSYDDALQEFNALQTDVLAKRAAHAELIDKGQPATISKSEKELQALETQFTLAQERVELALAERKSVQLLLTNLEGKLEQDRSALEKLPSESSSTKSSPTTEKNAAPATPPATSLIPGLPAANSEKAPTEARPLSPRVAEADSVATKKEAEANAAKRDVKELAERQVTLSENIALERERLLNAYKRHDNFSQTLQGSEDELYRELSAGKEYSSLVDVTKRRDNARDQLQAISKEIQDHSERLNVLQTQLVGLQQEEIAATREAADKEKAAHEATRQRWFVLLTEYALVALPRAAIIIAIVIALRWLLRLGSKRLVGVLARTGRGTEDERKNHAKTLVGVFMNAIETAIYAATTLMVLETFNVPVGTLMGGVAVVGLAVAFGAQNLIRDYFSGFMILLENQFKIGDVVSINNNTGTVERITLRITVLRDFEGKVYFIPNGQITSVINQTHEWSRVVLDISVAYKERIEKVMSVLLELAEAFCHEPGFQGAILREPELMGVERLGDWAVVIRLCLVTRPDKKAPVQREMLRRIKNKFEELGIEIPQPQQTVRMIPEPAETPPK
ncbi:MAG TPA: mechanosensitive ion channel domain-containing protein [Pirellulaceae bacterium]|nr:mechanosensitive ion channel domain-containing protein [Pirellulaceae bacterium]